MTIALILAILSGLLADAAAKTRPHHFEAGLLSLKAMHAQTKAPVSKTFEDAKKWQRLRPHSATTLLRPQRRPQVNPAEEGDRRTDNLPREPVGMLFVSFPKIISG